MEMLDRLIEHDRWATTQLLQICGNLTDAQLDQEFDIGHGTLRGTFDHLIYNIAFWTASMEEQPRDIPRDDCSIAGLIDRHEHAAGHFSRVARRARDEGRLEHTFIDHGGYRQSLGATILHVAMHNAEHRSEVLHMLQRLGVPDLPEFDPQAWEHRTQRRQG